MRTHSLILALIIGTGVAFPALAGNGNGHGHNGKGNQGNHGHPAKSWKAPPVRVIRLAPPPPVREVIVVNPFGLFGVWTPGFYVYQPTTNKYVWSRGKWAKASKQRAAWQPARWEWRSNSWTFFAGHWK